MLKYQINDWKVQIERRIVFLLKLKTLDKFRPNEGKIPQEGTTPICTNSREGRKSSLFWTFERLKISIDESIFQRIGIVYHIT
jgi:hypothetical protein